MISETLIQITVAIGIFGAGYAFGVLIRQEVVDEATGKRRMRWPWLTTARVSAVILLLLASTGVAATISVRHCQDEYNQQFASALNERGDAVEAVAAQIADLIAVSLDATKTPDERLAAAQAAQAYLDGIDVQPMPQAPYC